jgi:hypothetical protein
MLPGRNHDSPAEENPGELICATLKTTHVES